MDCQKIGRLIFQLRKEQNMTQKNLAEILHVTDKTISKWERGLGCPDVALLKGLSEQLGVHVEKILDGDLNINETRGGNMKRLALYYCDTCDNVILSMQKSEISCCGRVLEVQKARNSEGEHQPKIEEIDGEYYLEFSHPMTKKHFLSFGVYANYDQGTIYKLYPEQEAAFRIPKRRGKLFFYCTQDGLFQMELKK